MLVPLCVFISVQPRRLSTATLVPGRELASAD